MLHFAQCCDQNFSFCWDIKLPNVKWNLVQSVYCNMQNIAHFLNNFVKNGSQERLTDSDRWCLMRDGSGERARVTYGFGHALVLSCVCEVWDVQTFVFAIRLSRCEFDWLKFNLLLNAPPTLYYPHTHCTWKVNSRSLPSWSWEVVDTVLQHLFSQFFWAVYSMTGSSIRKNFHRGICPSEDNRYLYYTFKEDS